MENQDDELKPILMFIIITYSFSWIIWFIPVFIDYNFLSILWISAVGVFGPSIGAILISKFYYSNDENPFPTCINLKIFGITTIVFLITGFIYSNYSDFLFYRTPTETYLIYIFIVVSSLLTGFVIAVSMEKLPGIEIKDGGLLKISDIKWIGIAVLIPGIITIISLFLGNSQGYFIFKNSTIYQLSPLLPVYIAIILLAGPISEELGWRGYLTPKMIQKFSPLVAGLIIGIVWSIWHLPLHLNGNTGTSENVMVAMVIRFSYNVPLGILFTWYYIRSRNNLLGAMILHFGYNYLIDIGGVGSIGLYYILIVLIIIIDKMWRPVTKQRE